MKATPRTILTSILLLGIGVAGAYLLMATAPETKPGEREETAKLVQTIALNPRDEEVVVTGFGNVIPSRQLTIQPEVGGRVIAHHDALVPGGLVAKGEELLSIDPSDYDLTLIEKRADREEAVFELEVEKGRQVVAAREWEQLKNDLPADQINEALVLREPHLTRARAKIQKADNAIAQAQLALSRTTIQSPFNAVVLDESVEIDQLVATGGTIATIAGTDSFWVRVTLPISDLQRIRLPSQEDPGAAARVVLETGDATELVWEGHVTRLLGDLEPTGRMARVLVTVPDPLGLQASEKSVPLLLGSYVRVEIEAGRLENVLEIPRAAVREGDRLWLVGDDRKLHIRETEILWRRKDSVLVPNLLENGERLVVSDLKAALPGMAVSPQLLGEGSSGEEEKDAPLTPPAPNP